MIIFPAIDIIGGEAVRLYKGDYNKKTVYNSNPAEVAKDFAALGASAIHIVDLDGAKSGDTPNLEIVSEIKKTSGLYCEIGGGIRNMKTAENYISKGIDRVIIGTAAVTDEAFLKEALAEFGDKIAVGADIKDGYVAVKGWLEKSALTCEAFCDKMEALGVRTLIITDISKDGAMQGTNLSLYKALSEKYSFNITASGGVSSLEDVAALRKMELYGAIIGKAYYTGAINLKDALEAAK
ncbi:MAG: 1-(5-phosphoribosyl)-5-[(5-phosphoribosylamino)methylideneamino]imidazole-4-carboxamide isomerase [Oscillospiraceae bacterium]|nr:1-(5-phosphoribosyl)-5-[(5-phosphoribosylamino)methylideneamino]imidazole-4-carboxamide isomerase [Oscillospiraceae bacterium]